MPTPIGGRLDASLGLKGVGAGVSLPPNIPIVPVESIVYDNFLLGLDLSVSPYRMSEGMSPLMQDMMLTDMATLRPVYGVLAVFNISGSTHSLTYGFIFGTLNDRAFLVFIDPPDVGVFEISSIAWTNKAIAALGAGSSGWAAGTIDGQLIFSDGVAATYVITAITDKSTYTVTDVSAQILARTFTAQFGRGFAGVYKDGGGNYQWLGVAWNAASGDPTDWTGIGAGTELIVADAHAADFIVKLLPLGFDLLTILTRQAIWLGYPTGVADRPADFRLRISGTGCVHEHAACVCDFGIAYLSDDGVRIFDGNQSYLISLPINRELLPLNYNYVSEYRLAYDSIRHHLLVQTPTQGLTQASALYVYEFPHENVPPRWYKRPSCNLSHVFPVVNATTSSPYYVGKDYLGWENTATFASSVLTGWAPKWRSPYANRSKPGTLYATESVEITYNSAAVDINILAPDETGAFVQSVTKTLPSTGGNLQTVVIPLAASLKAGLGAALEIDIASGVYVEIYSIKHNVQEVGPILTSP